MQPISVLCVGRGTRIFCSVMVIQTLINPNANRKFVKWC